MYDALAPACDALDAALAGGPISATALAAASAAADDGRDATTPMLARKGRASYLGERSVGHQDPGATSTALLVATAARTLGIDRRDRPGRGVAQPGPGRRRGGTGRRDAARQQGPDRRRRRPGRHHVRHRRDRDRRRDRRRPTTADGRRRADGPRQRRPLGGDGARHGRAGRPRAGGPLPRAAGRGPGRRRGGRRRGRRAGRGRRRGGRVARRQAVPRQPRRCRGRVGPRLSPRRPPSPGSRRSPPSSRSPTGTACTPARPRALVQEARLYDAADRAPQPRHRRRPGTGHQPVPGGHPRRALRASGRGDRDREPGAGGRRPRRRARRPPVRRARPGRRSAGPPAAAPPTGKPLPASPGIAIGRAVNVHDRRRRRPRRAQRAATDAEWRRIRGAGRGGTPRDPAGPRPAPRAGRRARTPGSSTRT